VIAVVMDDDSTGAIARVAVQEAVSRGAPVRFIQIVPTHLDDEACSVAEESVFRAALHALRGHPRTPSVFEVVRSHVLTVVRSRSRHAALVVVGSDGVRVGGLSVSEQCLAAAGCPVRTVPAANKPSGCPEAAARERDFRP
jgi:nucleotide-binding universal stress UspA family protein